MLEARNTLVEQSPVGLQLRFTRAAEEAEAAALPFKVGPGAHQPRALIERARHLDLQPAFRRARAQPEDLQDQPGAVHDLQPELGLEVALLHRRQRAIDDEERDARPP